MKITPKESKGNGRYNTGQDELKIIDFQEKKDETLWDKVGRYLRWGLTASDKKGHTTEMRFRMRPVTRNMLGEIQSRLPDGFFKTQSHLYRAIFGIGCIVAIEHLKKHGDKDAESLEAVFDFLNLVARQERIDDLKAEAKKWRMEAIEEDDPKKMERAKKLGKMVKSLEKLW